MKFNTTAAAAVAVLALSSASAFAAASATATLTGFSISLASIKSSGPAPTASFTTTLGDQIFAYEFTNSPYTVQYNVAYGHLFAGQGSQTAIASLASSSASIVGDAFSDAGATMSTSSTATGSAGFGLSEAEGFIGLGDYGSYTSFTLGANTVLDIAASYSLSTTLTGTTAANGYQYAQSTVSLSMYGSNGTTSQNSLSSASIYSEDDYGYFETPDVTQTGELEVAFVGSRTHATTGEFAGSITSFAESTLPAVPEPTNVALMLAGLGALAVVSRRRTGR